MKKKWMVSTALLCSAALLVSGCGGKKADGFDAAGYTTAYLDGMIKGDTDSLASLSGTSAEDLTAAFDTGIDELVTSFFGSDGNTPGSTQISAQLRRIIPPSGKMLLQTPNTI